ncbi:thioredoxin family protein [Catenulispora sp. NL8]|uniref:Thioredoxin family protein n=1 Tax=Catenulispora pinistramenti TaxID=2705254 RepID=A0ABS5L012_9ACTN|nr:thioredoxin family protein [Catenulispora pinistramenti]MBS2551599.1 thioredoxin family protein [Catenulispora pinistramenti]
MDITGVLAAVGVLAAASAFGVWRKRTDGAVREVGAAGGAGTGAAGSDRLDAADLGIELDPRATLVQFSSKVCQYCGPTRRILAELADRHAVAFVDIDAEDRLDLARRLSVLRTPTVLVLDGAGRITHRVSGPPRRAELAAAVGDLVGAEAG